MNTEIQQKIDDIMNAEETEMEKMLAILDIEHSIVIDCNVGLIGEFNQESEVQLCHKLANMYDDTEKRGDYFITVGKYGTIILDEKVTHTFIITEDKINKYVFILKDISVKNDIDTFFDNDDSSVAFVIYNSEDESIRTNCKDLRYEYDKNIKIEGVMGMPNHYRLLDGDKDYVSILVNYKNNISKYSRIN